MQVDHDADYSMPLPRNDYGVELGVDVPRLVRYFRKRRRMSQREFADLTGVHHSTVERLETGQSDPRTKTLVHLAALAGCHFMLVDAKGRPLSPDRRRDGSLDRGRRHMPAHVTLRKTPPITSIHAPDWWGWYRIAWLADEPPEYMFWRRTPMPYEGRWADVL